MQCIVPTFGWNKLWHNNRNGFIGLALINDLFQIFEHGFNEEAEWRIENNETCSFPPRLPLLLDFFGFISVHGNVDSRYIIRKQFCITQGFKSSLMNSTHRHDDTVTCLAGRQAAELVQCQMSG